MASASTAGASASVSASQSSRLAHIPEELLNDRLLNDSIAHLLPSAYNFEIHKTIHHLRHFHSQRVALQMPEGLTMFATAIADIVSRYTDAEPVIMGDVTYGACCIDDYTARALGCDFLVHYAHSCLVPLEQTGGLRTLYVFVEIALDVDQLARTIRYNFPSDSAAFQELVRCTDPVQSSGSRPKIDIAIEESTVSPKRRRRRTHLALVGTVQFINTLAPLKDALESELAPDAPLLTTATAALSRRRITAGDADDDASQADVVDAEGAGTTPKYDRGAYKLTIPQIRPLSPGEILGCTSPTLPSVVSRQNRSIAGTSSGESTANEDDNDDEDAVDALLYLGDGRFHLESAMIANPHISAYFRFDPYSRKFEREGYDHTRMRTGRAKAVAEARQSLERARVQRVDRAPSDQVGEAAATGSVGREEAWGLVLGTLGRQGSTKVLAHLRTLLSAQNAGSAPHPHVPILLSELSPAKLALFNPSTDSEPGSKEPARHLSAFVQTSCPRLSIDWGGAFDRPLLSPYEAALALGAPNTKNATSALPIASSSQKDAAELDDALAGWERAALAAKSPEDAAFDRTGRNGYPMDFYADNSLGPWTPRHGMGVRKTARDRVDGGGAGAKRVGGAAGANASGSGGGGATAVLKELRRKRAEKEAAKAREAAAAVGTQSQSTSN
ncbi:Diphthamide biosynthesis protein 1 [Tilletia horrida]|uniref:2-(3-amino-3-carboxypropyl)histidine synthase subunit 1 n=1 Tax=Tilletia horrida TaxID=155126 RepID=A0AAN6G3K4_9BASI|nr:Diphthamide biosynthesis protein 1 [Tilletia horrida]